MSVAAAVTLGRGGAARKPANVIKPYITVVIDQHYSSKVYTSGSKISGYAKVETLADIAFDDFDIIFAGTAATRLDFVQQYTTRSYRPFMKLRMPIDESCLPSPRVFKAKQTYIIPFNFVVPHQLTIGACNHKIENPSVRDEHLRMPPTVGFWEGDDQAPEMAQIQYAIKARATRLDDDFPKPIKIMEGQHNLKVLPATPEDAPLDVSPQDQLYKLTKTKTIRKGLFSGKSGKLTASSTQPSAVMMSADGHRATSSSARIDLSYAPDSVETAPPKINAVSAKIIATTYFSGSVVNNLPNLGPRIAYNATPSLNYTGTTSLFSLPVEGASWNQESACPMRRDSGYSTLGDEDEVMSDGSAGGRGRRGSKTKGPKCPIKYSTSVEVPFTIPITNKKMFLPTFHNCLISRVYTLQLTLSVGAVNTSLSLYLPLQVGVETIYEPQGAELPSFESAMAQAQEEENEVNEFLRPRLFSVPSITPQQNSLLPGYEELSRRSIRVA